MAKLGFAAAGAAGFKGVAVAMIMGRAIDKVEEAMDALKEAGQDLGQKLQTIVIEPTKVAAKNTIAYAMEVFDFGGSINKFNEVASGVKKEAPVHKRGRSLTPNVPRQKL